VNVAIVVEATVSAESAHGDIAWQPAGAHGNRHGTVVSSRGDGADGEWSWRPGICIAAIAVPCITPLAGMRQANPLSTSTS